MSNVVLICAVTLIFAFCAVLYASGYKYSYDGVKLNVGRSGAVWLGRVRPFFVLAVRKGMKTGGPAPSGTPPHRGGA